MFASHRLGLSAGALLFSLGCGDREQAPPTSPSATATASAAVTATPSSPAGMSVAQFCAAHDAKLDALLGSCEKEDAPDLYAVVASGIQTSKRRCKALKDVRVVEDRVPACLATATTWHDAKLSHLQYQPACRQAVVGLADDGAPCELDLSCKPGSHCLPKPEADDLEHVCTPAPKEGAPCRVRAGHSCGPKLDCVESTGKCVARAQAGQACGSGQATCADGLACLRRHSKDPTGKCGPRRKDGEGCHQWAECEGRCKPAAPTLLDGRCASFCGSP